MPQEVFFPLNLPWEEAGSGGQEALVWLGQQYMWSIGDKVREVGKGQITKRPCIPCTSAGYSSHTARPYHVLGPSLKVTFLTITLPSPPTPLHTSSLCPLTASCPFPLRPLSQLWLCNYLCDYVINNVSLTRLHEKFSRHNAHVILFSSASQDPPNIASAQNIYIHCITWTNESWH